MKIRLSSSGATLSTYLGSFHAFSQKYLKENGSLFLMIWWPRTKKTRFFWSNIKIFLEYQWNTVHSKQSVFLLNKKEVIIPASSHQLEQFLIPYIIFLKKKHKIVFYFDRNFLNCCNVRCIATSNWNILNCVMWIMQM